MRTEDGLIILLPENGERYPGADVLVKIRAAETTGGWGIAIVWGEPGEGGVTHRHRGETEAFYILEGEMDLLGAESRTLIGPGTFVLIPPDVEHGLSIAGDRPARWLAVWPAALDGLFEALAELREQGEPSAEVVAETRRRHGMEAGRDRRVG